MKNTFEKTLPEGYQPIFTVDAKDKRTALILNVAAILLTVLGVLISIFTIKAGDYLENFSLARNLIFLVALLAYIVLHELVHGAAYKLLTGEKLTFGMTLSVAYCGVPHIYVYRRTALVALLSPFVVFTLLFGALLFLFSGWDQLYVAFLLSFHIGGCSGDLYDTILYLTKLRDPQILMQDTGPKQTFYNR